MNEKNSGHGHGTKRVPQIRGDAEALEYAAKQAAERAVEWEELNNEQEYHRFELSQTAPIEIPANADIDVQEKAAGYSQVKYTWEKGDYKYEARWHTHTPNAPAYSQTTWVIERKKSGVGYGKNHRAAIREVMIGYDKWVSRDVWNRAIRARRNGTATTEQEEMLNNGHWTAD